MKDIRDFHQLLKISDSCDTTAFEVPAGVIMATAVTLNKVTYDGLEGIELIWVVVRKANPPQVVCWTTDEAQAYRVYADEIDRARKEQSERTMWRR